MLNVDNKPFMLSAVALNVVKLGVVILKDVAPLPQPSGTSKSCATLED